ncbi:MAG: Ppx/GppA phosphatase family protein, partial [Methylocella sp.]
MHSPAMQGERLPEASGCNVGPVDGAGIGGPAIRPRRAGPRDRTGDIQGAGPPGRGTAKAVAGASIRAQADWQGQEHTYAALDLGTNNCRLLIASPAPVGRRQDGFRVIDSFSRIVRLGEGLSRTGELGAAAIERTLGALEICRDKMRARGVTRRRLIATEACRSASNGAEFLARVRAATGLELEIVDRETEARLAVAGSASLADSTAEGVILFDIGGGSSELIWLARAAPPCAQSVDMALAERIRFWVSLKVGVVTLAEQFGGIEVSGAMFEAMTDHAARALESFVAMAAGERRGRHFHLLGTSGTVTAIAAVFLGLARYDRRRVDGLWMSSRQVDLAVARLRKMTYEERAANRCIGHGRA